MLASTTFSRRSEGGFGLVRFLVLAGVAVVACGLGLLLFVKTTCASPTQARNGTAKAAVATLCGFVSIYQHSHSGNLPTSIDQLIKANKMVEEIASDPWGNKYQLVAPAKRSKDKFDLFSQGESVEDESDDIGNWGD